MTAETWYVMADGSVGDPRDVAPGTGGRLQHKDGRSVAYRDDGETPRSRSVDPGAERAKGATREVKPEKAAAPAKGGKAAKDGTYKTRETQAE